MKYTYKREEGFMRRRVTSRPRRRNGLIRHCIGGEHMLFLRKTIFLTSRNLRL